MFTPPGARPKQAAASRNLLELLEAFPRGNSSYLGVLASGSWGRKCRGTYGDLQGKGLKTYASVGTPKFSTPLRADFVI